MQRIAGAGPPRRHPLVAALWRCHGYHVGNRTFPSANVDEADLRRVLEPLAADLSVETRLLPDQARHGYGGILLARGRIRAAAGCAALDAA